ncbi:MAG: hypothetical protein ACREOF_16905 [Gemmatimonadales bacterium]
MKRLGLLASLSGAADHLPAQSGAPATDNRRFSAHATIDRRTVGDLVLRRVIQTGSARVAGLATVPVVAAGRMYVTTAWGEVIAYDLRRGRELWRYAPKLASHIGCCGR